MPGVAVVVDSTVGMSPAFASEHDVPIVPLFIQMQGQSLRDGPDITVESFYEQLPSCNPLPTTSQPSAGDFGRVYRELQEAGYTGIVSVHLSAGISGTCNSAELAAQEVEVPVEVIDTRCAASASLFAAEAAARAAVAGANLGEVASLARRVSEAQRTIFAVDTLEYLHKGGRIGGASALVGSILQFKPLLHFVDGQITALERVRTSSRALRRTVEVMAEWLGADTPVLARVIHAAAPERGEQLAALAREALDIVDMRIGDVPPVLGAHVGPGTASLCCCPAEIAGF